MDTTGLDSLKGKRVLLLAPSFFHYVEEIQTALDKHGILSTHFDDRAKSGFAWKIIARYFPQINERAAAQKLEQLCQEQSFDCMIVIKGESVSTTMFDIFEHSNPGAPIYLYLWDSIKNSKHAFQFKDRYTKVFTFDTEDAEKYYLTFLPLFVGMQFDPDQTVEPVSSDENYDLMFVGTAHSIRSKVLNQVEVQANHAKLSFFDFRFVQNRLIYLIRYLSDAEFRKTPKSLIHLDTISAKRVKQVMVGSNVIVDVTHPGQSGLTGRVIEALSMGRKVVTNNYRIKDYPVIDMRDVLVIPDQMTQLDSDFVNAPFHGNAEAIYDYFSVETWLKTILSV